MSIRYVEAFLTRVIGWSIGKEAIVLTIAFNSNDRGPGCPVYRLPSRPVRLHACSLPHDTNIEYGLDISGNVCSSAKLITS